MIKEKKVPVLVVLEGWGTAGKGYAIGQIIQNIDPRFFKVVSMQKKTEDDKRKPFLYRHFAKIPEAGQFVFLDTAWMDEITEERLHGTISEDVYANRIESVRRFERQLTDNGYLVMKFFLHISKRNSHGVLHSWSIRRTQHGVSAKKICGRMNIMRNVWMYFPDI